MGIRYIDEVVTYQTEDDLYGYLKKNKPNIRILGSDYKGKYFTGIEIHGIDIYFHERNHDYSTSSLREKIKISS